jgi:hypothetical protein
MEEECFDIRWGGAGNQLSLITTGKATSTAVEIAAHRCVVLTLSSNPAGAIAALDSFSSPVQSLFHVRRISAR